MEDNLHFIVVNDYKNDFNLMIEAYIGEWCIADLRQVNGQWAVTFFTPPHRNMYEISWTTFLPISQKFEKFITEVEQNSGEDT